MAFSTKARKVTAGAMVALSLAGAGLASASQLWMNDLNDVSVGGSQVVGENAEVTLKLESGLNMDTLQYEKSALRVTGLDEEAGRSYRIQLKGTGTPIGEEVTGTVDGDIVIPLTEQTKNFDSVAMAIE